MPFSAVVSPEDLLIGEIIKPGWKLCVIDKYEEKEAGTDKSVNCLFHFKVIEEGTDKGKSGRMLLNEKALGMGKLLYKALGFPQNEQGGYNVSSQLFEQAVGTVLGVYFKTGTSNKNNNFNDPVDFKPAQKQ